jgi:hypothetical protein
MSSKITVVATHFATPSQLPVKHFWASRAFANNCSADAIVLALSI